MENPDHATIVDVAREADVSYITVSRVTNNNGNAKTETREREGYTYPTAVRDVVAREQAEQQQRTEASRAYAALVQQVLREKAKAGDIVLVERGEQVVLLPLLPVRKEVSYSSQ